MGGAATSPTAGQSPRGRSNIGACKNLVKDRMERSGMRWSPDMAEAMLRLRATHLSADFDAYWDFHVHEDQKRLCDHDAWTVVRK